MNTYDLEVINKAFETKKVDWDAIFKTYPILLQLEGICQNPVYHAEGNVLKHTKMAVERLIDVNNVFHIQNSASLFLAVLFHDIGKLVTTKEEDGVFSSNGHSAKGARMIREILWDFDGESDIPWTVRENVATMTLLHMLPVYLLEKEDPLYSVCASSHTICNKDLAILAEADCNGRICESNKESLSAIELFRDFCVDSDCYWDRAMFQSDHARFLYFFEHKGHPNIDRYFDKKGTAHIMSGLPGAGKDYYIKKNLSDLSVISLDDIREETDTSFGDNQGKVLNLAKDRCKELMRKKADFVLNATNFIKPTRARWIRLFRQYDYEIEIHYIEPPFTTLMKQNLNREKPVPEGIVREMFKKLEPPTLLECHKLHLIV